MFCSNCGNKDIIGAKFCKQCGIDLNQNNKKSKRDSTVRYIFFIPIIIVVILVIFFGFRNGSGKVVNTTQVKETVTCNRKTPYPNPPEFERAIGLLIQRSSQNEKTAIWIAYQNCIDIQYANLNSQAEGYFYFDNTSTVQDLKITVDRSYSNYDDLLTSFLLIHELTHVGQYIQLAQGGGDIPCVEKEAAAFHNELMWYFILNQEEQNSVIARLASNPSKNSAYAGLTQLINIVFDAQGKYSADSPKIWDYEDQQIRNMIINNPYYKKECNLK